MLKREDVANDRSGQCAWRPSVEGHSRPYGRLWVGLAVAAIAAFGLAGCDSGSSKAPPAPSASVTPSAEAKADNEEVAEPDFAPPPPPEPEEVEAPKKPAAGAVKGAAKRVGGGTGPCSECGKGVASPALSSAVSRSASLARGCYQRALRGGDAQGSLTVSVRIGSHGGVCGASIVGDTLHNPGISQCVLSKFRGRSFPKPEKGCVVINIPFAFKMK